MKSRPKPPNAPSGSGILAQPQTTVGLFEESVNAPRQSTFSATQWSTSDSAETKFEVAETESPKKKKK